MWSYLIGKHFTGTTLILSNKYRLSFPAFPSKIPIFDICVK